ncbi:helix-turn-helix transcriptional regulator [Amycolatopsis sp. QT-25]|uniref:ArsR/SmtB family transcription factor n=1 Tax=Amycolatopsis sp. QT-25 TaxID=3034022 RepID=UPI0023ED9338|nr:helix-turn-helix transcriptional regulator [Amycolatopsis sp. QT-25]WET77466.1 helix-turn-helix transcriptional regulator [Amycolatopsis sp. QT-25]
MLRIYFSTEDLLRVRLLAEPHRMWEILLSLHLVQTRQDQPVFGGWRRKLRPRLPSATGLLTALARPTGYSPDFLTPSGAVPDLETGLDLLLGTTRARLKSDIAELARHRALPTWVAEIADGEVESLRRVATALRVYHREAIEPFWSGIRHHVELDRRSRADVVTSIGFEAVLAGLHPAVRWRPPVLEVDYPVEQDLYLDGRGLVLVPSFFCWGSPITTLSDDTATPMLVYPVERSPWWAESADDEAVRARSLTALLGRTRATVLRTIADLPQVNTTDLANLLGISLAGASQHTTVLRNAGLVQTARTNGAAVHRISQRGSALLRP